MEIPSQKIIPSFKAVYLKGATEVTQFPQDQISEIAFIGRSNSGKSTALNSITSTKGLARVSKTPGRTQMINFFDVHSSLDFSLNPLEKSVLRFVDLPGYGYAKISIELKKKISQLISAYLCHRPTLKAVVLLMDIRHPLQPNDVEVLRVLPSHISILLLLTKADKLSSRQQQKAYQQVLTQLSLLNIKADSFIFSANYKIGIVETKHWIEENCASLGDSEGK